LEQNQHHEDGVDDGDREHNLLTPNFNLNSTSSLLDDNDDEDDIDEETNKN